LHILGQVHATFCIYVEFTWMTHRAKPKAPPLPHLQILLSLSPIAVMYSVYCVSHPPKVRYWGGICPTDDSAMREWVGVCLSGCEHALTLPDHEFPFTFEITGQCLVRLRAHLLFCNFEINGTKIIEFWVIFVSRNLIIVTMIHCT
jgi:hypothetical protein